MAFDGGFLAEADVSYAGPGAGARARLAGEVVAERMHAVHGIDLPLRVDLVGVDSLHASARRSEPDGEDVRLRCAMRSPDNKRAQTLLWEVESLMHWAIANHRKVKRLLQLLGGSHPATD